MSDERANGNRPAGLELDGTPAEPAAATAERPDRPDPEFEVIGAAPLARAAVPTVTYRIRATDGSGMRVQTIALRALIIIEPAKRSYVDAERERLVELFGEPQRWAATTDSFRWTQADVLVPEFRDSVEFEIAVPCSYDLELISAKYFAGLEGGEVPLRFDLNGSVFYEEADGRHQVIPLPWDRSTRFAMPHEVWSQAIAAQYPFRSWVPLDRETVDRLAALKAADGAPTYDAVVSKLLDAVPGEEPS